MNKLIIVASLVAITTPSFAKTKVFGELHASYDKIFPVGESSRDDISLNDSIFGVKGAAEIKRDVSFIYQFVWGVSSSGFDSVKKSGIENRSQVLGLASPSGALILGRFDTPFKTVGKKADLFWHSQLGQNRNVTNAQNWDVRADKIIIFQSPKKNGFQGSIAYSSDIADTSRITQNASAISLNGFYRKGKFHLGAAYEQHDFDNSSIYASAKTDAVRLSAIYRGGPLKMVGFYQKENNDFTRTTQADASVLGVGVAYKKGKGTYKAQFYTRDIDSTNGNSDLIAVGYDYKHSKKLDIYAQTAKISNATSLNGNTFVDGATSTLSDAHGVALGIRYKF